MAASATDGKTLWEYDDADDVPERRAGDGQRAVLRHRSSSAIASFTAGVAGRLQCFEKKTGKLQWTQQLWTDHHGSRMMYGYASSPIAFRDTVIVPVGGRARR